ncbi:MAG: proprotein convertase P-domain-containing protein [Deltaproteobacteria bacterium]|nr:proprotein convertase P-domain-containing protein [Deltaproteobacteria bacterium]
MKRFPAWRSPTIRAAPVFSSTISVPVAGTITDVDVGILVTHTWRGDVHLRLRSPDGTEIALYYDLTSTYGDDANNLYGTFDASSVNTPADGFDDTVADYTNREFTTLDGSTLTTDLNDFIGKGTLGTWTLKYCDKASPDTGTLDGWGLYLFLYPRRADDHDHQHDHDDDVARHHHDDIAGDNHHHARNHDHGARHVEHDDHDRSFRR